MLLNHAVNVTQRHEGLLQASVGCGVGPWAINEDSSQIAVLDFGWL